MVIDASKIYIFNTLSADGLAPIGSLQTCNDLVYLREMNQNIWHKERYEYIFTDFAILERSQSESKHTAKKQTSILMGMLANQPLHKMYS